MTMDDIRVEGRAGRLGRQMTAVVVDGPKGKEYRMPTERDLRQASLAEERLDEHFADVPYGVPDEPSPAGGGRGAGRAFSVQGYGIMYWRDLFTSRQLIALAALVKASRLARKEAERHFREPVWEAAIASYLAAGVDRFVDFANVNVQWKVDADTINHALVRFAIQITWDFAEGNPLGQSAGSYQLCINRIATGLDTMMMLPPELPEPTVKHGSAQSEVPTVDLVVTDPPYYDAIPYSDLMDWFYIWLRRSVSDLSEQHALAMREPLGPKWDPDANDGELVDDESRHGGDIARSKQAYEDGMAQAFLRCAEALNDSGRLVIVFANKSPAAWETVVAAVIRAGFIVDGSWPIQTEQPSRMRGLSSAALASSVWLVCKRRPAAARPGWDNRVLEEMRANIGVQLREFWDAGIRGPDFVWAATGPAMEAFSKHPVVRKANEANATLGVSEFLNHVRRMVVDYVVGQVLTGERDAPGSASDVNAADRLDEVTAYYLLQRPMAGTLIDLLELAPAFGVIAWASGASPATTARAWAALAGSLLVANLLGVVVAVAARSLAETALFAAVAALVLLHASGVFRTPSPGSGWSVAEDVSPFRSLHEAMLALAGGVGIDLDPGVWLWVPGTATLIAALSPPLSRRLRTLHRNT